MHKFESGDSDLIREATREIVECADRAELQKLLPHVQVLRELIQNIEPGGATYSNRDLAELALSWIEQSSTNVCRCMLYQESPIFSPEKEAESGHVGISGASVKTDLYEKHFEVECNHCRKKYLVREVHGWHVPWYEWK